MREGFQFILLQHPYIQINSTSLRATRKLILYCKQLKQTIFGWHKQKQNKYRTLFFLIKDIAIASRDKCNTEQKRRTQSIEIWCGMCWCRKLLLSRLLIYNLNFYNEFMLYTFQITVCSTDMFWSYYL